MFASPEPLPKAETTVGTLPAILAGPPVPCRALKLPWAGHYKGRPIETRRHILLKSLGFSQDFIEIELSTTGLNVYMQLRLFVQTEQLTAVQIKTLK